MATESEKEALAGKYGMNMSDLEALLEANPELADSLSRSFGASLMPGLDVPRGQSVGPYGAYVASSPLSRLAQGGMEGYKVGAQQAGQKALLDALRGGGPAAGSVMESPQAGGAMGDNDAQMGGGMFGDTTEDPMAPQPVPDMMGGAQATGVPTGWSAGHRCSDTAAEPDAAEPACRCAADSTRYGNSARRDSELGLGAAAEQAG
jgi:hypothetical protein